MVTDHYLAKLKAESHLGKRQAYRDQYSADLLFAIPREPKRAEINVTDPLPFYGVDIWNAYEVSWLNNKGKPVIAIANIEVPCESSHIFESKSLKLYCNSFNGTQFANQQAVQQTMAQDLSTVTQAPVKVALQSINQAPLNLQASLPGKNIDELDIRVDCYTYQPDLLQVTGDDIVRETLNSDLLKSNCLVTEQPDWGSIYIAYQGRAIEHASLLKYIISLREHNEFHEQCVERIFMDISHYCQPQLLSVYARYTRRGGIDINPWRSNEENLAWGNERLIRQ